MNVKWQDFPGPWPISDALQRAIDREAKETAEAVMASLEIQVWVEDGVPQVHIGAWDWALKVHVPLSKVLRELVDSGVEEDVGDPGLSADNERVAVAFEEAAKRARRRMKK